MFLEETYSKLFELISEEIRVCWQQVFTLVVE